MKLQLWEIFALVLGVVLALKSVKAWLAIAAVLLGLYLASTTVGQTTKHTIDHITHQPSTTSTATTERR
jgi:F0F1-type ATP synthase membrane subunit c/vacuolar-type H+-ATPase subunit K